MTIPEAVAAIDKAMSDLTAARGTIAALVAEIKTLRRDIADRDGRIAELHSQLGWRATNR